jgi:hypothetical protein
MSLQPLSTGQLLDKTFTVYRQHFLTFVAIGAVPPLIINVAMFMFQISGRTPGAELPLALAGLVLCLVYVAGIGISQAAISLTVADIILDRPVSASSSISRVKGKALRYAWVMFCVFFVIFLGFIALIIPGIYFTISLALTLIASVNEDLGFSAAMKRSKQLVKGDRNRIAVIYLLSFVVSYTVAFAIAIPAAFAAQAIASTMPNVAIALNLGAGFLGGALVAPFALIGFTLAYFDARVRKEAFDLQMMMESPAAIATGA